MKHRNILLFFLLISFGNYAQNSGKVDFKHLQAQIAVVPSEEKVSGKLTFLFDVLGETDSVFIDAHNMQIENVMLNGAKVPFLNDGDQLWILSDLEKSAGNSLYFEYTAFPSQTMYFIGWENIENLPEIAVNQVWTQGQGRKTSYWLPSFDDPNEKLEFDFSINFKEGYRVIANGKLEDKVSVNDSITRWTYSMDHPMSSYLVALAAGKYTRTERKSESGVPLILYFYPGIEAELEPTYRHSEEIFNFLEQEIGVPYPWQNYKQIPVRDFLYSGMENTGTTIFSDIFITDSVGYKDRNYIMVNAHELAHQWFGDAVTAVNSEHHWLQEGFATYYALLAEKRIFGDDFFYWRLYEIAEELKARSDLGKGQALISSSGNSTTYYFKGAWALHFLRQKIGDEAFRTGIKRYLNKYKYQNVSTEDFIAEMEKASDQDLSQYVAKWLKQSAFQGFEALNTLKTSDFIINYLKIAALKGVPLQQKKETLGEALDFPVNDYIGQEVVYQLALENPEQVTALYQKAFATHNIFVRQAIATSLDSIPQELKQEYESLLQDESYLTKEIALYNLWMNFPGDRKQYLDELKGVEGFFDKNIRTLWLALHLATPNYEPERKQEIYTELSGYTAPYFPFQIRQNAFKYLYQLNAFNDKNLGDLLLAAQHPVSRFRQFSREMLARLLENAEVRQRYEQLKPSFTKEQQEFLEQEINKLESEK